MRAVPGKVGVGQTKVLQSTVGTGDTTTVSSADHWTNGSPVTQSGKGDSVIMYLELLPYHIGAAYYCCKSWRGSKKPWTLGEGEPRELL